MTIYLKKKNLIINVKMMVYYKRQSFFNNKCKIEILFSFLSLSLHFNEKEICNTNIYLNIL